MQTLIIDNVGFDVLAMSKMSEEDFVALHLEIDCIARHKSEAERKKYLKDCHKQILAIAKPTESSKSSAAIGAQG